MFDIFPSRNVKSVLVRYPGAYLGGKYAALDVSGLEDHPNEDLNITINSYDPIYYGWNVNRDWVSNAKDLSAKSAG